MHMTCILYYTNNIVDIGVRSQGGLVHRLILLVLIMLSNIHVYKNNLLRIYINQHYNNNII